MPGCLTEILPVVVDRYWLIWIGHHGDQHVEEDNDVATGIDAEHQQCPEPGEFFYTCNRTESNSWASIKNCKKCQEKADQKNISQYLKYFPESKTIRKINRFSKQTEFDLYYLSVQSPKGWRAQKLPKTRTGSSQTDYRIFSRWDRRRVWTCLCWTHILSFLKPTWHWGML